MDRELLGAGVVVLDEPLGGGDEVVEDVLFAVFDSLLVPVFAVFAAAAKIGDGEHPAEFHPAEPAHGKRWGD